jgi:hypothetical protein
MSERRDESDIQAAVRDSFGGFVRRPEPIVISHAKPLARDSIDFDASSIFMRHFAIFILRSSLS